MTGFAYYMSQALRPNPGIYLPLAGGVMSGDIDMDGHQVTDLPGPAADLDAATKKYHDDNLPAGGYTQGCRVYHNAHQNVDGGVWAVTLNFNSEVYDTDGMHDNAVNNERITFKTAGIYLVIFQMKWSASGAGRRLLTIWDNSDTLVVVSEVPPPPDNNWNCFLTTLMSVNVNDYITARVYHSAVGVLQAMYDPGSSCHLMAQRIG
ncbi:hypothetical protein ES705_34741 [subsurface metagenome]